MASDNEFDLDNFSFDTFDEFSFNEDTFGEPIKDDRKPVTRVKQAFIANTKNTVRDTGYYSRLLRKALPKHYREALDIKDEMVSQGKDLYNSAVERSAPTVQELKRRSQKFIPTVQKYLPEKLAKKIEKLLETNEDFYSNFSEAKQREAQITTSLADIFTSQLEMSQAELEENRKRSTFTELVDNKRHEQNILLTKSIANGIGRLVGYQDTVALKYQQKSIELQYRQLFAIRDIVTESQRQARDSSELLKSIAKNTGLPDAIKLHSSEHFGQTGREKAISLIQDKIGNSLQPLISRIGGNIHKKVMEKVGFLSDISDQMMQARDMEELSGGSDIYKDVGGFVGSAVTDKASDAVATRLQKLMHSSKFFRSTNAILGSMLHNAPNALKQFANADPSMLDDDESRRWWEQDDSPFEIKDGQFKEKGFFKKMLGNFLGLSRELLQEETGTDNLTVQDRSGSMTQPVAFNKRMGVSITDVIPGLLARQLQEITHLRTGEPAPLMAFDYGKGVFTTTKGLSAKITDRVANRAGTANVRYQIDRLYDSVDPENKLDADSRKALDRQLLLDSRAGMPFDPTRLSREKSWDKSINAEQREKLAAFFKAEFIDSRTGGRFDNYHIDERVRDSADQYTQLLTSIPAILSELELQINLGNTGLLVELGLLIEKRGGYEFNFDAIMEMLLSVESKYTNYNGKQYKKDIEVELVDSIREKLSKLKGAAKDLVTGDKRSIKDMASEAADLFKNADIKSGVLKAGDFFSAKSKTVLQRAKDAVGTLSVDKLKALREVIADKLTTGPLYDAVTKRKITKIDDIVNNVVDSSGNVVIYAEDVYKQICETVDSGLMSNVGTAGKEAFSATMSLAKQTTEDLSETSFLKGFGGNLFAAADNIVASLKGLGSKVADKGITLASKVNGLLGSLPSNSRKRFEQVKRELDSILTASSFKDAVTGDKVTKFDDIVNDVVDSSGNVVISVQEVLSKLTASASDLANEAAVGANDFIMSRKASMENQATQSRTDDSEINALNQKANDLLQKLIDIQIEARTHLDEIKATIKSGIRIGDEGLMTGVKGGDYRRRGLWGGTKDLLAGGLSGVGSLISGTGTFYKKIFSKAGGFLGGGMALAGGVANMAGNLIGNAFTKSGDIYVKGESKSPVLSGKFIRRGHYRDVTTGKIIKTIKDIKGPVADITNGDEIVLTAEEYAKGLYDVRGKPLIKPAIQWLGKFYGAMFSPLTAAAKITSGAMMGLYRAATKVKDIYTPDNLKVPKLYAKMMAQDVYYSQVSGKTIRSISDIDGPVMERIDNTVVLSMEDFKKGLVDWTGRPLRTIGERTLRFAKGALGLGVDIVKNTLKAGLNTLKFAWKMGSGLVKGIANRVNINFGSPEEAQMGLGVQTVDALQRIYMLLDERLPKAVSVFGDTDGDGDAENSWKDILEKRKQKKEEDAAAKANSESEGGKGFMSKMSGLFGGLFNRNGKDEDDDDDDGDTYIGSFGGDGDDKKDKKKGKKSKPKGRFGRFMEKGGRFLKRIPGARVAGTVGRGLLGFGARAAGMAAAGAGLGMLAGGGALGAVGAVLGTAAAIISSPVVLAGLALGTAAYIGYKLYTGRKGVTELREIRFLQYGSRPDNDDNASRLAKLEKETLPDIQFQGDSVTLAMSKEKLFSLLKIFGINQDNTDEVTNFVRWFDGRFKPIFLRHVAVARSLDPKATPDSADSDFSAKMKLSYLEKVKFPTNADDSPYRVVVTPFGKANTLFGTVTIEQKFNEVIQYFTEKEKEAAEKEKNPGPSTTKSVATTVIGSMGVIGMGASLAMRLKTDSKDSKRDDKIPDGVTGIVGSAALGTSGEVAKGGVSTILTSKATPPQLDIIRFKAYGLVELEIDKINTLRRLEEAVSEYITFDGKGNAVLNGDGESYAKQFAYMFNVSDKNPEQYMEWISWFNRRFAVVLVEYYTAGKRLSNATKLSDFNTYLDPQGKIDVALSVIGAKSGGFFKTSIWDVKNSPWENYTMNTDSESTKNNLEELKAGIERKVIMDNIRAFTRVLPEKPAAKEPGKPLFSMTKQPVASTHSPENSAMVASANPYLPDASGRVNYKGMQTSAVKRSSSYIMPAEGRITSDYGMRTHPIQGIVKGHGGIDIAAAPGTPIRAVADGTIIRCQFSSSYGNVIYIKHEDGKTTRYAHMSAFQPGMKVGAQVYQGDIIGYMGNTGASAGTHLHFEVREDDSPTAKTIDPMKFLDDQLAQDAKAKLKEEKQALKEEAKADTEDPMEGEDTIASTTLNTSIAKDAPDLMKVAEGKPVANAGNRSTKSLIAEAINPTGTRTQKGMTATSVDISSGDGLKRLTTQSDEVMGELRNAQETRARQLTARDSGLAARDAKELQTVSSVLKESLTVQKSSNAILSEVSNTLKEIKKALGSAQSTPATVAGSQPTIAGARGTQAPVRNSPVDLRKSSLR